MKFLDCGTCGDKKAIFLFAPGMQKVATPHCIKCMGEKNRRAKGTAASGRKKGMKVWRQTMGTLFLGAE